MNEERFAYRLCQRLNCSLDSVSTSDLRRLEAARHHALNRQKHEVSVLTLAKVGGRGVCASYSRDGERLRQGFAILLLLLGILFAVYWQGQQYVQDLEDVDSALLTDDIPPHAFLDKDFAAWLDDSSEE